MLGSQAASEFGYAVRMVGDYDLDGFADVAVTAPYFDNGQTDEGKVFLYSGGQSGLATTPSWTAEGDQDGCLFGLVVSRVGDVNGDAFPDLLVSAPEYDGTTYLNEGQVRFSWEVVLD